MRDQQHFGSPEASSQAGTADPRAPGAAPRWARAIRVRSGGGVRSGAQTNLQLVCDTGIYSVDAALQPRDAAGWFVLGQVFLRNNQPAEQLEVVVHEDGRPGQVVRTDAFGEFACTSDARQSLGVAIHGPELALVELWRGDQ